MNAKQRRHHYGRITVDLLAHRRRFAHISLREQLAYDRKRAQKKRNRRIQRWRRSGSVSLWWAAAFEGAAAGVGAALAEWTHQISVASEEATRALLRLGVVVDETGRIDLARGVSLTLAPPMSEGRMDDEHTD